MSLLFSSEARRQFDPIAKKFDLICVAVSEQFVRYENDKVILIVNFDSTRSYELEVEIGKKNTQYSGPAFSLAEVLRLRGVQDAEFVSGLMISNEERLPDVLSRLAKLTINHASDFLMGIEFSFMQIEKMRTEESAEFELASQIRLAKSDADAAWSVKNYEAIVKVLKPLEQYLSLAEKKRLEYSQKQLTSS
jgi:hypothetical protein